MRPRGRIDAPSRWPGVWLRLATPSWPRRAGGIPNGVASRCLTPTGRCWHPASCRRLRAVRCELRGSSETQALSSCLARLRGTARRGTAACPSGSSKSLVGFFTSKCARRGESGALSWCIDLDHALAGGWWACLRWWRLLLLQSGRAG